MSVLKIEITDEHLKLLKYLNWSLKDNLVSNIGHDGEEEIPPFGQNNLYEGMALILNGKPEDFDPLNTEEETEFSEDFKAKCERLYSELPLALEVILQRQSFSLGTYKAKYHDRVWKQIK
jgi:hypothetical protein